MEAKAEDKQPEEGEKRKSADVEHPTPDQQRDIVKKIEHDRTTYSYFICKSWFHQWKYHVNYDDLGLDDIMAQPPSGSSVFVRKGTRKGPTLAMLRRQQFETASDDEDEISPGIQDDCSNTPVFTNQHSSSAPADPEFETSCDQSLPTWVNPTPKHTDSKELSSTPIKQPPTSNQESPPDQTLPTSINSTDHAESHEPPSESHFLTADDGSESTSTNIKPKSSPTFRRNKPRLTRVCKNQSKTELDSSFDAPDTAEPGLTERTKPINPSLTGLMSEGVTDGSGNTSMSEIFEQVCLPNTPRQSNQSRHSSSAVQQLSLPLGLQRCSHDQEVGLSQTLADNTETVHNLRAMLRRGQRISWPQPLFDQNLICSTFKTPTICVCRD